MTKIPHILALALLFFNPLLVSADENVSCEDLEAPVTSVADLDGNGVVNGKDIAILAKSMHRKNSTYSALLDRNADGEVDDIDIFLATRDMSKESSEEDQNRVTAFNGTLDGTYTCAEETEDDEIIIINEETVDGDIIIINDGGGFGGGGTISF